MKSNLKAAWAVFSLIALIPAIVFCQSFQATVSGIVTDPTGAVVPERQGDDDRLGARRLGEHHHQPGWCLRD